MRRIHPASRSHCMVTAATCLFPLLSASACNDQRADVTPAATLDTINGVVHVTNPERTPTWRAIPAVAIGTSELGSAARPDEFGRINSILADEDGRIYVAEGQSREVRVFDAAGTFLQALGREGSGPGEFGNLYSLAWFGDELAALDPGNARVQLMTRSGEAGDVLRWMPLTGRVNHVRFYPTAGGDAYLIGLREPGWQGWSYVRHTRAGPADTISIPRRADAPMNVVTCRLTDAIRFFPTPFSASTIAVPIAAGRAAVASTDAYRVALLDAQLDTLRVITRPMQRQPVSDADWDEATREYREFRREASGAACEGSMTRPTMMPLLHAIHVTHEGGIVVEVDTAEGTVFDFLDDEGRIVGSLPLPPRDRGVPPYIRADHVYQVELDDLDVQRVAVYRIQRN